MKENDPPKCFLPNFGLYLMKEVFQIDSDIRVFKVKITPLQLSKRKCKTKW